MRTNAKTALLSETSLPPGSVSPQMVEEADAKTVSWLEDVGAKVPPIVLPILYCVGGFFSTLYGGHLTYLGINETRKAMKGGDRDGIAIGLSNTGIGASFTGMGLMMLGSGVADTWAILRPAVVATAQFLTKLFAVIMSWLGLVLYTFYAVGAICALPELSVFGKALHKVINQADSPKQRSDQSLQFLEAQVCLTEGEKRGLTHEACIQKERMKRNQFIRRVGNPCADNVIRALRQGNLSREEVAKLTAQVHKGNFKQKVMQISMLAAGILGLIGTAFMLAAVGGWVHYAFFAGASVLYWLNSPIGNVAYKALHDQNSFHHVRYILVPVQAHPKGRH